MSIPRELRLERIDGQFRLTYSPVDTIKTLRRPNPFTASQRHLLLGTTTLSGRGASGDTLEIKATFRARDADRFGLRVRVGNGQHTTIGYDVRRGGVYVDRTKSGNTDFSTLFPSVEFAPLPVRDGKVTLRILVDRSSVEIFGQHGRIAITDQVFPDADSKAVQIFSTGGRAQLDNLTIWQMKSIWS
jgi:levanase